MRALTLSVLLAVGGCSHYRFMAGASSLPGGVRAVWAPVFVNRTAEPAVEVAFTEAFRQELARNGVLGDERSGARLEGEILSLAGAPTLLAPTGQYASYRLTAVISLKLVERGRVVSAAVVSASEDYLPGTDVLLSEANRKSALARLSELAARDGYDRLATGG